MIQSVLNPYRSPLRWDYVKCCGVVSPGVIPRGGVQGFKRVYSFAMQGGYGMFGADLTFAWRPPAEGTFRIWTWTSEQYDQMGNFLAVLEYDPTKKKVTAIDILYPSLACIGIRRVVTTGISPPKHQGGKKYEWEIDFKEFRPVPKQSAVSTPVTTKKNPKPFDDPQDSLIASLENLNKLQDKKIADALANGRDKLDQ
jgi:hypothetical protein